MLFGLCVFSLPQIRRRFYESFYVGHVLMAITYLGLLFWHAGDAEDSWAYLWATLAIWLAAWFSRLFWFMRSTNIRSQWFVGAPATLKLFPAKLVRIEVERPADFRFRPGQHAFLRFPSVSPLDNHPFTIASAPNTGATTVENGEGADTILFLAKVREGFTRKLARYCLAQEGKVRTSVSLDGPYGCLSRQRLENRFDALLLVAGGSGISPCLSWLLYTTSVTPGKLQNVTLVWAVRDPASLDWISEELQQISSPKRGVQVSLRFFVTGSAVESVPQCPEDKNKSDVVTQPDERPSLEERIQALGQLATGRPDLQAVMNDAIVSGKSLAVFACGPHGMNHEVANICAAAQQRVFKGDVKEICLHVETFGW